MKSSATVLFALLLQFVGCSRVASAQPVLPGLEPEPNLHSIQLSEYIREVFQDADGCFWFGTNGDGVCRYDGKTLTFLSVDDGLAGGAIRGILQEESGAMWFATSGGVSRYEAGVFTNFTTADGLSADSVWNIMQDGRGTIWASTHEGLCRYDGKMFMPFPIPRIAIENPTSRFSPKVVFGLGEDTEGNLWFGTDGEGVHKFDGESFTSFTAKDGLASNQVRSVLGDRNGSVWVGTNGGGVSRIDGNEIRNFTDKDGLNNNRVYEMYEDSQGSMWFSTLGAGISRYDGTTFTSIGVEHGIASLHPMSEPTNIHVQEFCEDADGVMWLGCSGGLFRMAEDGTSFENMNRKTIWNAPVGCGVPTSPPDALAAFARMMPGKWDVTLASGTGMSTVWQWGPGMHSVRAETSGQGAAGEPWRGLRVYYVEPKSDSVRFLGLSTYSRSVSEGTFDFKGDTARGVFDLHQEIGTRKMGLQWEFDDADTYRETLLEVGQPPLGEWKRTRSKGATVDAEKAREATLKPSGLLKAFERLAGHRWESNRGTGPNAAFFIETRVEYIPFADYVHAEVFVLTKEGEQSTRLDVYFFHHTGSKELRCLAFSDHGGVHEGLVETLEDGSMMIDVTTSGHGVTREHVVRIDLNPFGKLRTRVWAADGSKRAILADSYHEKRSQTHD